MGVQSSMFAGIILAFLWQASALAGSSPDRCTLDNQACQADSIIDTFGGVNLEECRALCSDTADCKFITFFGPESFPLHDYCFLFSDCSIQLDCEDCVTETEVCFDTCSTSTEGRLGEENILDIKFDVEAEVQCKLLCRENSACEVYTYFHSWDETLKIFPNSCFLTSRLVEPIQTCDNCKTGYPDCDNLPTTTTAPTPKCGFTIDDSPTVYQSFMFTKTTPTNVSVSKPQHANCLLNIVLVGGGGASDYGGGGSGYVKKHTINIADAPQFRVKVGRGGRSEGWYAGEDGRATSIDWLPFQWNEDYFNGIDNGKGSGLSLSTIHLDNFLLNPG